MNNHDVDIDIKIVKRDKCFDMDGAEIKDDLLEINFGRPDEEKDLLKQRQYSVVAKICVHETVQYTVAFLWCWPMINFLRIDMVACL